MDKQKTNKEFNALPTQEQWKEVLKGAELIVAQIERDEYVARGGKLH